MSILEKTEMLINAAGRIVPELVNGRPEVPYKGVGKYVPPGCKSAPPIRTAAEYPSNGDKHVANLETALRKCGLRDRMVISSHHHLRDGDRVALMALEAASLIGAKDLMWFPSASFPSQKSAIALMEAGVIDHIEGSMNGPLGDYCTQGKMRGMGVLRSHGGSWQAILRRLPWKIRLRIPGFRIGRLDPCRSRHRGDGQSRSVPMCPLANTGQQC
jgi:citrate lyase subunit alpha / citrate CoA-transferase